MYRVTVIAMAVFALMLIAIGCSGGTGGPVVPLNDQEMTADTGALPRSQQTHTSLLGYYDIYFDVESQTMEIVEDRTVNFTINIVPFLNQAPGSGISFGTLVVDDDDPAVLKVDVEFQWHHPFPTIPQYKVYDFMGVIISDGDQTLKYKTLKVGKQGNNTYMTNADGYTRWFNPTEFTTELIFGWAPGGIQNAKGNAKVNPYKYYAKGLTKDADVWAFLTGPTNNEGVWQTAAGRTMSLEFPTPPAGDGLTFAYAAVCCWEEQGDGPYTPYHRDEVIACNATVTDNIWYDGASYGGNLIVDFDLFAWDEQPSVVKIESTVHTTSMDVTDPPVPGGIHYSTYSFDEAVNKALTTTEGHEFWIIAESTGYNYVNIVGVPAASGPLAAFFRYPLFVADEPYNERPIIDSGVSGPTEVGTGTATYNVTAHDVEGDPLTYSWTVTDLSTGLPATGYDGVPGDGAGNLDVTFGDIGVLGDMFDIDCVVSDPFGSSDADTLTVEITNNPPVIDSGVDGEEFPFFAGVETYSVTAHDDDGDPLTYSWTVSFGGTPDPAYDGVPGDGAGNLDVDWGAIGGEDGDEYDVDCDVSDGMDTVPAATLMATMDVLIYLWDGDDDVNGGMTIMTGGYGPTWTWLPASQVWDENGNISSMYGPQSCTTLETPQFNVPAGDYSVRLELTVSGDLPPYSSYGICSGMVGYSTDGGSNWFWNATTASSCDTPTIWLTDSQGTNFNWDTSQYNLGLYMYACMLCDMYGYYGNWQNIVYGRGVIAPFASPVVGDWRCANGIKGSSTVKLGFNFNQGGFSWMGDGNGWQIHKIKVYGTPPPPPPPPEAYTCDPVTPGAYDASYELTSGYNSISGVDDGGYFISLPFTFNYAGQNYSSAYIEMNGGLSFTTYNGWYPSGCPPGYNWDWIWPVQTDLDSYCYGEIRWGSKNVGGLDCFIVQWYNYAHYYCSGSNDFMIVLVNDPDQAVYDPWMVQYGSMGGAYEGSFNYQPGGTGTSCCLTAACQSNTQILQGDWD